jgi:Alpha helical Porin B.
LAAASNIIDNFDCGVLREGLIRSSLADDTTTRNELANKLTSTADLREADPTLALLGNTFSGRIADRSLTCNIVTADPQQDIVAQLQALSSILSSTV